jgi:hypothetical protein
MKRLVFGSSYAMQIVNYTNKQSMEIAKNDQKKNSSQRRMNAEAIFRAKMQVRRSVCVPPPQVFPSAVV